MHDHGWLAELASEISASLARRQKASAYTATPTDNNQDSVSSIGDAVEQSQKLDDPDDPARKPDGVHISAGLPSPPEDFKHEVMDVRPITAAEPVTPARQFPSILSTRGESGVAKAATAAAASGLPSAVPAPSASPGLPRLLQKVANIGMPMMGMPTPHPYALPGAMPAYGRPFMPYAGAAYGTPYGMPPYGMPPYGMPPYGAGNPWANSPQAALAFSGMPGVLPSQPDSSSRLQDRRQQLEEARLRMSQINQAISSGRGAPVSQQQLEEAFQRLQAAAEETGSANDASSAHKVYDPISRQNRQVRFGYNGSTPSFFGRGETPGLWDWLMQRRSSPAWMQYQRERNNYQSLAARYAQWQREQEQQRQELSASPFAVSGAADSLRSADQEYEADRQQNRQDWQQMREIQRNALRQMTGPQTTSSPPPAPLTPPPPSFMPSQPQAGPRPPLVAPLPVVQPAPPAPPAPQAAPGREVRASYGMMPAATTARKAIADAATRLLLHTGAGGVVGGAAGLANGDANNPLASAVAGAGRGMRTGLSVGIGGEAGDLAGQGIAATGGHRASGGTRMLGRLVGTLAGAVHDPSIQKTITPEPPAPTILQRMGLASPPKAPTLLQRLGLSPQ